MQLNITVTEVGVNMGDHGQDVTRAVHVDPDTTTLAQLAEMMLTTSKYDPFKKESVTSADSMKYLTIRAAEELNVVPLPAPVPAHTLFDI